MKRIIRNWAASTEGQRGFSLLETMLVVFILSIVLGIVVTGLTRLQVRNNVETSNLDITQEARSFMDQLVRDLHETGYPTVNMYASGTTSDATVAAGLTATPGPVFPRSTRSRSPSMFEYVEHDGGTVATSSALGVSGERSGEDPHHGRRERRSSSSSCTAIARSRPRSSRARLARSASAVQRAADCRTPLRLPHRRHLALGTRKSMPVYLERSVLRLAHLYQRRAARISPRHGFPRSRESPCARAC